MGPDPVVDIPPPPPLLPGFRVADSTPAPAQTEDSWLDWFSGAGDTAKGLAAAALSGAVSRGVPGILGAPVDLVNMSPMLGNLLPGEQGIGPISDRPLLGSQDWHDIIQAPNDVVNAVAGTDLSIDYQPRSMGERFAQRIGAEVGAAAVPLGYALNGASRLTRGGDETLSALQSYFLKPAYHNPRGLVRREIASAVAAGSGAQGANEIVDRGRGEGTAASDFLGSVGGAAGMSLLGSMGGAAANLTAAALSKPKWMDEVAGEAIAHQIINNSQILHDQAEPFVLRGETPVVNTRPLADLLRTPTSIERQIPGYTADVGARSQDPRLQVFVSDVNARAFGAGNKARAENNAAINKRVGEMAPQGDPGRFRLDLQAGVDGRIASALTEEELARAAFDEAATDVRPALPNETARGSDIRAGLQGAYDAVDAETRALYEAIDNQGYFVDFQPLQQRFAAVDQSLPVNDQLRFRPTEADTPNRVMRGAGANAQPGTDIAFPGAGPQDPPLERVPLREATAIRSGLSNEIQKSADEPRRASIAGKYRAQLDAFLSEEVPPEAAAAYDRANKARFDQGLRFEESTTAIAQALRKTGRGEYQLDASALPRKFLQPDSGKISDYRGLMREAGSNPDVRAAIADQAKADIQPFLDKPERLRAYVAQHNIVLSDFPELRAALDKAGVARETLAGAEQVRVRTERDLTTPGRTPEAGYLQFGPERSRDAIRRVINDKDPAEAVRSLIATAATPEARGDLRAALWQEVKGTGQNSATDSVGQDVWNPREVRDLFNEPKFDAVARELWKDDPEDLESIKSLFTALEAATSGKVRAPGSSGTAQALAGADPSGLTAVRITSDLRSNARGVMSPPVIAVGWISTWLRSRSARVQSRAIDTLAAQVVNNPGLAANLLDHFNPATYAASRQMLSQKYGVRAYPLLNLLDQIHEAETGGDETDVRNAIEGED